MTRFSEQAIWFTLIMCMHACMHADDVSEGVGPVLLSSGERPTKDAIVEALTAHRARQAGSDKGPFGGLFGKRK